ncbi:hypothetical protein E7Y31_21290 [Candidatus Frankia alpina]|uniref:Uncharacterized protein n=1 Tax=Candidatus Frankia alpina TaxID=2699483 RepID=A0A4S5BWS6_9ACTN|nr:hypothetical protein E7Y31_21290 [Candidatus Frankia alpina]
MASDPAEARPLRHHATVSVRARGQIIGCGPYLAILAPVLLGILLMHGGLFTHVDPNRRPGGLCGSDGPLVAAGSRPGAPHGGAAHQRPVLGHPAGLEGAPVALAPDPAASHGGHVGQLCLAFLQVTGILLATLLLARAVRAAVGARTRARPVPCRPGRSPPGGGLPRPRAPSLARLCVLRV